LQQWAQEEGGASLAASTTAPRPTRACHIRSVRSGLQDQRNVINGERLQDRKKAIFVVVSCFLLFFLVPYSSGIGRYQEAGQVVTAL
jgi:hypothetical protein